MQRHLLTIAAALALSLAGCDVVAEEETTTGATTLPEGVEAPEVDIPQPPCNEFTAKEAVKETELADAVTASGKARAVLAGGSETDFRRIRFGKNRYRVELLECADITEDEVDEMIVALAPGKGESPSDWAIFTPANAAEWQLVLPMEGSPVSSFEITGGELRFETPTSEKGGSGAREGTVSFDAEGERFVVEVPGSEGRTIEAKRNEVVGLGRLDPQSADLDAARKRFATPTSIETEGSLCRVRWSDLGLTINFANFGGGDPCGPEGRVASVELLGGPAAAAGWETEEGIGVGAELSELNQAYGDPPKRDGQLVLEEKRFPFGAGKTTTVGALVLAERVIGFQLFVGAGGE